jgi:hypothetical protein
MYPANAHVIRPATPDDEFAVRLLAELDSQRPLDGPILIGELGGVPAVAISLTEGRLVADPFQQTAVLGQVLRMRAAALQAHARAPSLPERLREAMAPFLAAQTGEA